MLKAPTLNKQIKKLKLLSFTSVKTVDTVAKNLVELKNLFVLLKKTPINFRLYFNAINLSYWRCELLLIRFKKKGVSKISEINHFTFKLN